MSLRCEKNCCASHGPLGSCFTGVYHYFREVEKQEEVKF